jgi:tetratricopeptide (TPR) repeat protein
MHNQSQMRCMHARMAELFGEGTGDQKRPALVGTESTANFDARTGVAPLHALLRVLRAQLLVVEGRYPEALEIFERDLEAAMDEGALRLRPSLLADMAWCQVQLGASFMARQLADEALASLEAPCDLDDRALTQAQLARTYRALGEAALAASLDARARQNLQAHRAERQRIVRLLEVALAGTGWAHSAAEAPAGARTAPC